MTATGNEPVKLSQLKSVVTDTVIRKFDFTITEKNTPVQLPFAPDWGILVDVLGTHNTTFFVDYGNTVQLLSFNSNAQVNAKIYLYYKGTVEEMSEKLANVGQSLSVTSVVYQTYGGDTVMALRTNIEDSKYPGGFTTRLNIKDNSTTFYNWPWLFINFFFEK